MSSFDFDTAYSAHTGEYLPGEYIPDVQHDEEHDVLIGGIPRRESDPWHVITGRTNQYSYSGAVLHPSEWAEDDKIREWVADAGGDVFALVEVRDDDGDYPDGDPIGWAIVYRADTPPTH